MSEFLKQVAAKNSRHENKGNEESTELETPKEPEVQEPETPTEPQESEVQEPQEPESTGDVEFADPLKSVQTQKPSKQDSMSNLRAKLNSEKETNSELAAKVAQYEKKLNNLTESEEVKQLLQEKEQKIEQLKKYEDLVGLYKTDGYKQTYYDAVDTKVQEAAQIAKDYEVDPKVIQEAANLTNRKQLNEYLNGKFGAVGASDIRPYILDIQSLVQERDRIEENPEKARQTLLAAIEESKKQQLQKTRKELQSTAQQSWGVTREMYEDVFDVLKPKAGNAEHENRRKAILEQSQQEFSKALAVLAEAGAQQMPKNLVASLASRYQLSDMAAHLHSENQRMSEELAELREELEKTGARSRPMANSVGQNGAKYNQSTKERPANLAATLMQQAKLQAQKSS